MVRIFWSWTSEWKKHEVQSDTITQGEESYMRSYMILNALEPCMIIFDQMKNRTENRSLGSPYIKFYDKIW